MDAIMEEPSSPDSSSSSPPAGATPIQSQAPKRSATDAGLKSNGLRAQKSVKRRASKACQCCRARKVRCNVVEHGAPCTNCRLDEVECIVSESKRKKKWSANETSAVNSALNGDAVKPTSAFPTSAQPPYESLKRASEHVPHTLYQDLDKASGLSSSNSNNQPRTTHLYNSNVLINLQKLGLRNPSISEPLSIPQTLSSPTIPSPTLPAYIKNLPARLGHEDVFYLQKKGALAIPDTILRNELLRNYAEYVHPYMPSLDFHSFVTAVDGDDASNPVSLLLFQSVMFAGVATVDLRFLKAAGYGSRREARRDFFQKARLLYDFDIEMDRIALIQALLLMSYWYETPDDQKDSHHWMGIAVSLSHTIGLHRDQQNASTMEPSRRKLWKRIWWCTYMRDRLIALGMRRPTKIKNGDFDVPLLTIDDFDIKALPLEVSCITSDCTVMRDVEKQRQLAVMCIEKAKLSNCISNVLSVQYSVLHNNHGVMSAEGTTKTTMMLVAKKLEPREEEVQSCDRELCEWKDNLPEEARYTPPTWHDVQSGNESMILNRSLLHMIYYATFSALHRPQVLPSGATPPRNVQADFMETSRKAVRIAASEITAIANSLQSFDLVRLLPTPGITVLLPAIIIHLLDIKSPDDMIRRASLQGFCQCMQILGKLRDIYAAADYSTAFLEAAIRKAEITLPQKANEVKEPRNVITSAQGLIDASKRMNLAVSAPKRTGKGKGKENGHLTPPPEDVSRGVAADSLTDDDLARRLNTYLASTPPDSDHLASEHSVSDPNDLSHDAIEMLKSGGMFLDGAIAIQNDLSPPEPDFEGFINLDAAGEIFSLEDGAFAAMQGESSGFTMDVDWMREMQGSDGLMATSAMDLLE